MNVERVMACIVMRDVPRDLQPINQRGSIHQLIDTRGWRVASQEIRDYGAEYLVVLERPAELPVSLHPCCTIVTTSQT